MIMMQVVMLLFMTIITGIGALYVRRRPRVRLEAIQSGGGQER
jgi:cysteine sulfinate desulfinase/cysteine desulfurase-like protein